MLLFNILASFCAGGLASCALAMLWYFRLGDTRLAVAGLAVLMYLPGLFVSALAAKWLGWLRVKLEPARVAAASGVVVLVFPASLLVLMAGGPFEGAFPGSFLQFGALAGALAAAALLLSAALWIATGRWDGRLVNGMFACGAAALAVSMGFETYHGRHDFWSFAMVLAPTANALLSAGFGYGLLRSSGGAAGRR